MIPYTGGNKTAWRVSKLAHEAGGPVTTSVKQLEEWTGVKGRRRRSSLPAG